MADLSTEYMGLRLRNPIIVGSSGLTGLMRNRMCEPAFVYVVNTRRADGCSRIDTAFRLGHTSTQGPQPARRTSVSCQE